MHARGPCHEKIMEKKKLVVGCKPSAAIPSIWSAGLLHCMCSTGAPVPQPAGAERLVDHIALARQLQAGRRGDKAKW